MNFEIFSNYAWYELWSPVSFIVITLMIYVYTKKIVLSSNYMLQRHQALSFYITAISLFIVKGTPLKIVADHYLFSAHVLEIMTVLFIALPLIILSLPAEWARQYFWSHRLKFTIKLLGHPWMAALLFNGALTAYFTPKVFNMIQSSLLLSLISQLFLLVTGFLMWWTIIMPLPEISKLSYFTRVAYILLNSILLMPIGIYLLIIISQAHYPVYEAAAGQLIPSVTPVYDQQLGGGVLKAIQLTSYVIGIFFLIRNWSKKEDALEGKIEDESVRIVQGVVIHLPKK